jgi:hypothetical protein
VSIRLRDHQVQVVLHQIPPSVTIWQGREQPALNLRCQRRVGPRLVSQRTL